MNYRVALAGLLIAASLAAQVSTGSVAGQVTDQSRGLIAGATVTLINQGTNAARTATTDTNGSYTFPLVAPGVYRIGAAMAGFKTFEASGLEIQVAQRVTQNIVLEVGDASVKVEVVESAPVLEQRSAEVGQVIGHREVVDLPLNGRNFLDLAKLVPGVTELAGTSQSNGISINGQRANQIGFYFDGIDTRTETSGKPAFSPSIEAIQEFRIQQNDFAAEFGRSPAAINLTLKSGSNQFHGTAFEFMRNNVLDARSFFARQVDPLRRHQFGGVLSGPVLRQKTFLMVNYEGLRTRRASTLYQSLPSANQRDGNFAGGPQIFDPATYDAAANRRQAFAGNVIPKSRFGLIGNSALKYYPVPNSPGVPAYNNVVSASSQADADQFHTRVDHQIGERDLLFGRFSSSKSKAVSPSGLPLTGGLSAGRAYSVTVQESHTFDATRVNQLRIGWTYFKDRAGFPLADRNLAAEEFGLLNLRPAVDTYGLPQLVVAGLTTIGANAFQPGGPRENLYSLGDDITWIAGKHSLKFGFDGRYYTPHPRPRARGGEES